MNFKAGDRVRYHGQAKACLSGIHKQGSEHDVIMYARRVIHGSGGLQYVYFGPNGSVACYISDLELVGPVEPEEYETWFVN